MSEWNGNTAQKVYVGRAEQAREDLTWTVAAWLLMIVLIFPIPLAIWWSYHKHRKEKKRREMRI